MVEPSQLPSVRLPLTCIAAAMPTPRRRVPVPRAAKFEVARFWSQPMALRVISRHSTMPVLLIFQPCTLVAPAGIALRLCTSIGSMPSMPASTVRWQLSGNCICCPPKPRNAPRGGLLVYAITACERTFRTGCMLSLRMAVTCITSPARPEYAPHSAVMRTSLATIMPSADRPMRSHTVIGTLARAPWKSSSRLLTRRTGRSSLLARKAQIRLLFSSTILAPKPPPVVACTTRMVDTGRSSASASRARARNTDWVEAHSVSRPLPSCAATEAIGSR
ncbi:hypothetical protein D9M72_299700 [compost metagenome]